MTRESAVVDPRSASDAPASPSAANPSRGGGRPRTVPSSGEWDDRETLWAMCVAIAERRRQGLPPCVFAATGTRTGAGSATGTDAATDIAIVVEDRSDADRSGAQAAVPARMSGKPDPQMLRLHRPAGRGWEMLGGWSNAAREMFGLYSPLLDLATGERYLLGHLGQSIDGRIATRSGDSCFINGQQNLIHMHRLRALCDAVLVGAGTVVADDPQLTTRLVPGPNATRVVLDPSLRLTPAYRICADDGCPTLIARLPSADDAGGHPEDPEDPQAARAGCGSAEVIPAVASDTGIDLPRLLDCLAARGLHAILVEGGGITVSRFLAQGLLNRLQIAIAPLIIGSGRQGLQLPEVLVLSDCLRPSCRHHRMGQDVLWDFDMKAGPATAA